MLYIKYISTCVHLQTGRANLLFWVGKFINSKLLVLVCKKDVCKCGEKEIVVQLWMTDWTDWLQVTSWKVMKKDWENEWKIKSCSHWNFLIEQRTKAQKGKDQSQHFSKSFWKYFMSSWVRWMESLPRCSNKRKCAEKCWWWVSW